MSENLFHQNIINNAVIENNEKGKIKNDRHRNNTWFQMERYPSNGSMKEYALHGWTYVLYKISGKNVGPFGKSDYIDNSPIIFYEKEIHTYFTFKYNIWFCASTLLPC